MKPFATIIIALVLLAGCKKDEKFTISQESANLNRLGTLQLNASVDAEFKSLDTNIAYVSSSGLITGNRIGSTDIAATADGKTLYCRVTVSPRSMLYREPLFEVASSCSDIKNYETRELVFENAQSLIYNGENSDVDGVIYLVGLSYDGADVLLAYSSIIVDKTFEFLDERYLYLGEISPDAFAYDVDEHRAVVFNYDVELGYNVMYLLLSDKAKIFDELKSKIYMTKSSK